MLCTTCLGTGPATIVGRARSPVTGRVRRFWEGDRLGRPVGGRSSVYRTHDFGSRATLLEYDAAPAWGQGRQEDLADRSVIPQVIDFVTPIVRAKLSGVPPDDVDDVCQEAWIAVWQGLESGTIRNWKGLASTVAQRRAADYLRRRRVLVPLVEVEEILMTSDAGDLSVRLDRAAYFTLELLRRIKSACEQIAIFRFFEDMAWDQVGRELAKTADAAKQAWMSCKETLRDRHGDELRRIMEGDDGGMTP